MKGYSKMKITQSPSHPRSTDPNPDQWTAFEEHTDPIKAAIHREQPQETGRKIKNTNEDDPKEEETKAEATFSLGPAAKLKRNASVSAASTGLVKKAFSMRRSSSVADRYCRIHDQSSTVPSPTSDVDSMVDPRSGKRSSTRGRILKACKKLFRI